MRFTRNTLYGARRLGLSAVEVALILAGIAVVAFVGVQLIGGNANTQLNTTSTGVADPAALADQFNTP